jgi:hypothetical protein
MWALLKLKVKYLKTEYHNMRKLLVLCAAFFGCTFYLAAQSAVEVNPTNWFVE